MPHYSKEEVAHFEIEAKPLCFIRRFFPYLVGKSVRFRITIKNQREDTDGTTLYMFESFNGKEKYISKFTKDKLSNKHSEIFIGNRITNEGSVEYKIGTSSSPYKNQTTIFWCKPIDALDRFAWLVFSIVLTAALTTYWETIWATLSALWGSLSGQKNP